MYQSWLTSIPQLEWYWGLYIALKWEIQNCYQIYLFIHHIQSRQLKRAETWKNKLDNIPNICEGGYSTSLVSFLPHLSYLHLGLNFWSYGIQHPFLSTDFLELLKPFPVYNLHFIIRRNEKLLNFQLLWNKHTPTLLFSNAERCQFCITWSSSAFKSKFPHFWRR